MYKSKRFSYTYDDYEDGDKDAGTMLKEIMEDEEFPELEEVVVGCWGEAWEDDSAHELVDGIVAAKEKFSHIKSLFIGDMDYEDCEVSWIMQADYSELWAAMPQLEKLIIKGSTGLELGSIEHDRLEYLEIICGGLPVDVIQSIQKAKLPSLQTLKLYIGIEDYGFDGDVSSIKDLLEKSDFPKLTYLGIMDSEIQDEITEVVLASKYIDQVDSLDLSYGSLSDKGGQMLLDELPKHPNIKKLNIEYHFLTDGMEKKLEGLAGVEVNLDDQQEADEYDGQIYYYPMLTE